jgi:glycine hydroxymethyltransferase
VTFTKGDEHDPAALATAARRVAGSTPAELARRVETLVADNAAWRGRRCLNLVAAESPTSPAVRALLSAEVGTRASGGHIGPLSRCFPGLGMVDEIEALCIELLKRAFGARHADHRLLGGMAGCMVAVTALAAPGDTLMSLPVPKGGDSSGRQDGPPGVRGLRVVDIPCSEDGLTVELDAFRAVAEAHRPRVVSLNQAMTLFPLPVGQLKEIVAPWGGRLYFDGAHQAGLIAAGVYPHPLAEGADLLTGSGGKTFSGPQSGLVVWDDDRLSRPVRTTIFPTLTGSHQINRVAALAVATAEQLEYGRAYMRQTVANAVALATALARAGFTVFAAERGYTRTHQILVDVRGLGPGISVAQALERADIMVNKMLLPSDPDRPDAEPSGIRLGTVEVTRLGMRERDMATVAGLIRRVLLDRVAPEAVRKEVAEFRESFQRLYYCFDAGLPPS